MHAKSATIDMHRARIAHMALLCMLVVLFAVPVYADHEAGHTGSLNPNNETTPDGTPQLTNNGIFGCLGRGAQVANVGTTRAIGGVYVPVNDAAVTLNTGYIVYKECLLDGLARKISESGAAELAEQELDRFYRGRAGQAQYLQNYSSFLQPYNIQITYNTVQDAQSGGMCGAFRNRVASAVARSYAYNVNGRSSALTCASSDANRAALIAGTAPVNWNSFMGLVGGDYELARYYQLQAQNDARIGAFNEDMRQMILAGRGVIPIFDNNQDPLSMNVVTPGFLISDSIGQAVTSGYRQLENATEIDQVVSNLFAGLTTRIVGSASGIPGLFVSTGNQPAYIDRMVGETRAAVRTGAVNAAVVALSGYRQGEAAYLEAKQGIANALLNTIAQLRAYERQCWDLIIPAVQTYAQQNGNPTLSIATSTQFSQAVIDNPANNIRTLASTTAAEVTVSQQALAQIDQLIAAVTNSGSSAAQQQALVQIDQMIANGTLHSQQDAQTASSQRDTITAALNTLLNDTRTAWGDSQDPNIGWCNVNNPATVQRWFDEWR